MKKIIASIIVLSFITGCSSIPTLDDIIPDKRKKYRKSRDLPALEIPPDLTTERVGSGALSDNSTGGATSLSDFERQQATGNVAAIKGEQALLAATTDETRITIPQSPSAIWPKLSSELKDNDYLLDVEDADLGVMETLWKNNNPDLYGVVSRNKVRIVSERTSTGSTVLFISSQVELNQDGVWNNTGPDRELEKELASKIGVAFNVNTDSAVSDYVANSGSTTSAAEADFARAPAPTKAAASIKTNFANNQYMVLPQEYTIAFPSMERLLGKAGIEVKGSDEDKGTYNIYYNKSTTTNRPVEEVNKEEEKGFFSKLKFWGDGKDELEVGDGRAYIVSLTGVGDNTEVVVLDAQGEWTDDGGSKDVLYLLQQTYNN